MVKNTKKETKLNIGCGHKIFKGWINLDRAPLPGVDVVHDLTKFPWPFDNQQFDEVYMKDVLEHFPDTIKTLEEIYRVTKPGAKMFVAVPYWNSWEAITDPTHVSQFNEYTFEFFDPNKLRCKNRPYYSAARFKIIKQGYVIAPFAPTIAKSKAIVVFNPIIKRILSFFSSYLNNIIIGLDIYLERVP